MPTIKQKTTGGRTVKLKRYETQKPGKQYEYYVTAGGSIVDDPVYTREDGMRQFRDTVQTVRRAEGEERTANRGPSLPGFGGGGMMGGPSFHGDKDGDDDDEPFLPGF